MEGKDKQRQRKKPKKDIKTMDIILIIVGVSLLLFTLEMIHVFEIYGAIPDTLVSCVFACLGGECGIMGWIKTTKDKNTDRKWHVEDEKRRQKEERAQQRQEPMAQPPQDDEPPDVAAG